MSSFQARKMSATQWRELKAGEQWWQHDGQGKGLALLALCLALGADKMRRADTLFYPI